MFDNLGISYFALCIYVFFSNYLDHLKIRNIVLTHVLILQLFKFKPRKLHVKGFIFAYRLLKKEKWCIYACTW